MSDWNATTRAFYREQTRMHPGGILPSFVELIDLLEAAETRAATADALTARVDAANALHQPESTDDGRLVCAHCLNWASTFVDWPCATAEALSAREAV